VHRLRSVVQRKHLATASPDDSVYGVAATMADRLVGAILIVEDEKVVGIFSERDLMTRVVVSGRDAKATRVGDVMTRDVITATPDESVDECLEKMQRAGCRHLPVLADGRLIAMVSMRDLLRDEIEEQETEIRSLRAYLHQMPG
jgi:CBS domain-containing protein